MSGDVVAESEPGVVPLPALTFSMPFRNVRQVTPSERARHASEDRDNLRIAYVLPFHRFSVKSAKPSFLRVADQGPVCESAREVADAFLEGIYRLDTEQFLREGIECFAPRGRNRPSSIDLINASLSVNKSDLLIWTLGYE